MTVLVMALYITNSDTSNLYGRPYILWLICPLLLYWVTRIWLITYRGKMNDDPVLFAIRDRCSYVVAAMVISVGLLAI